MLTFVDSLPPPFFSRVPYCIIKRKTGRVPVLIASGMLSLEKLYPSIYTKSISLWCACASLYLFVERSLKLPQYCLPCLVSLRCEQSRKPSERENPAYFDIRSLVLLTYFE